MRKITVALFMFFVVWFVFSAQEAMSQPQYCDENNPLAIRFGEFEDVIVESSWFDDLQKLLCEKRFEEFIGEEFFVLHSYMSTADGYLDMITLFDPRGNELATGLGSSASEAFKGLLSEFKKG